jgi:hypothetical protein
MTPAVSRSPMSPPCVASGVHAGADLQCLASDRRSILLLTVLGSSMAFMDGSVVNVALPTLQTSFRASSYHILWVVQAYSLLGSALLLFCGALGDRFGRARIYLLGVAVRFSLNRLCGIIQPYRAHPGACNPRVWRCNPYSAGARNTF